LPLDAVERSAYRYDRINPGITPVPIEQKAGWASELVQTICAKFFRVILGTWAEFVRKWVLCKVFVPLGEEVTGSWRQLRDEERHD